MYIIYIYYTHSFWVSRFIDDLCAIYNGKEFLVSFENIYPKEL